MAWLKENKFLAGLIGVTLALALIIIFYGLRQSTALEEVQGQIEQKKADLKGMKSLDPFPTPESAKTKKENLEVVVAKANAVRDKMLSFRPESLENPPTKEFTENLTATVERVKALFDKDGALPERFHLGFETYTRDLPKEEATGILTYQAAALEYLLQQAAEAGIEEIVNLDRPEVPAEKGFNWDGSRLDGQRGGARNNTSRGSSSSRRRGRAKTPQPEVFEEVAHRMPVELTIKGPEKSISKFLANIANSDQFFFETRLVRVLNPSPIPTAPASAAKKEEEEVDNGGFDFGGGDDNSDTVTKILEKVSGGDDLVFFIRADLLLFMEGKEFPKLK